MPIVFNFSLHARPSLRPRNNEIHDTDNQNCQLELKMASMQQTNGQTGQMNGQRQENPYDVSPVSFDTGSASRHESWLSGQSEQLPGPTQQNHIHQQNHGQQENRGQRFAANWPLTPVTLADITNHHPPTQVPPRNNSMVTPENSLEDVSLSGPPSQPSSTHQVEAEQPQRITSPRELEDQMQAASAQSPVPAPPVPVAVPEEPRPSSFEIMGCLAPDSRPRPWQLTGTNNDHARQPGAGTGAAQNSGSQQGLDRTPTLYPSGAAPPSISAIGVRHMQTIEDPEAIAGGHMANDNQSTHATGTSRHSRQPSDERFGTKRLIILIATSSSALASFLLLTQSVAVMTIFRDNEEPLGSGYIVECVLSLVVLLLSVASLLLLLVGKDIVFPYTLRSPFTRRQPPQPKEFELGSMSRPATAGNQDIEHSSEQQHQLQPQHQSSPQPALPRSLYQGPAESRELLLESAAATATVAPSITMASIVTELCDAVSAPEVRR